MRRTENRKRLTERHLRHRFNQGPLLNPHGRGFSESPIRPGAWVAIAVNLRGDRIVTARFVSSPDPLLEACASLLTDLVTGHSVDEAFEIRPIPLWEMLWLGVEDMVFVVMVVEALRNAIDDMIDRESSPPLRLPRRLQ